MKYRYGFDFYFYVKEDKARAGRRARDECAFEVIPEAQQVTPVGDEKVEQKLPGYLGTFEVDCKEVSFIVLSLFNVYFDVVNVNT